MLACDLPVVAADVGVMSELFAKHPDCLYAPGNHRSLVRKIQKQLVYPDSPCIEILTWTDLAKKMEGLFLEITDRSLSRNCHLSPDEV
jgi:glycosyltransferase involved in cell wall biosynthesis